LISAATNVAEGRVKICAPAVEKAANLPFGSALDFRANENVDDPLRAAAVLAISLAFDPE
jgi:hypothetical protein